MELGDEVTEHDEIDDQIGNNRPPFVTYPAMPYRKNPGRKARPGDSQLHGSEFEELIDPRLRWQDNMGANKAATNDENWEELEDVSGGEGEEQETYDQAGDPEIIDDGTVSQGYSTRKIAPENRSIATVQEAMARARSDWHHNPEMMRQLKHQILQFHRSIGSPNYWSLNGKVRSINTKLRNSVRKYSVAGTDFNFFLPARVELLALRYCSPRGEVNGEIVAMLGELSCLHLLDAVHRDHVTPSTSKVATGAFENRAEMLEPTAKSLQAQMGRTRARTRVPKEMADKDKQEQATKEALEKAADASRAAKCAAEKVIALKHELQETKWNLEARISGLETNLKVQAAAIADLSLPRVPATMNPNAPQKPTTPATETGLTKSPALARKRKAFLLSSDEMDTEPDDTTATCLTGYPTIPYW